MRPERIKRTAGGAAAAQAAAAAARAAKTQEQASEKRDLDDPATQMEILNPKELRYTLQFADGRPDAVIILPTQFTINDIQGRRIFDDLESLVQLLFAEMSRFNPLGEPGRVDLAWVSQNTNLLAAASSRSVVRDQARELIAKIAKFPEPMIESIPNAPPGTPPRERWRPTIDEITLGMSSVNLSAITLFFVNRALEEQRKNVQGTVKTAGA